MTAQNFKIAPKGPIRPRLENPDVKCKVSKYKKQKSKRLTANRLRTKITSQWN